MNGEKVRARLKHAFRPLYRLGQGPRLLAWVYPKRMWLSDQIPDLILGMDTCGTLSTEELGLDARRANAYVPARWSILKDVLRPQDVAPSDVFVDFGSGKGRALYLAARYRFAAVIGVDISPELNAIARRNLARQRRRLRCKNVQVLTGDVVEYAMPDTMTVAFFFNPFPGPVFKTVIEHILESAQRRPRNVRVIYGRPVMHDYLIECGFVEQRRSKYCTMYTLDPPRSENTSTASEGTDFAG